MNKKHKQNNYKVKPIKIAPAKNKLQDIFVSAVVVTRPESVKVNDYIVKLFEILNNNYTNYEIVVVDNGLSVDEVESIKPLLGQVPCVRILRLSRISKHDVAVFAGLEVSIGDYVCTLDPTIDPINEITKLIAENQTSDVVQGVSRTPIVGVFGSQLGRRLFYWYNRKYICIDIPLNATYFAAYSRRAINFLTSSGRNHRYIRHSSRLIGSSYSTMEYNPTNNPSNQRSLRTGIVEALEIVTTYSSHPLRFVTWLGFVASLVNVGYALYVVILNLSRSNLAPGWTSTSMQLSLMFFVLFVIMIILSEYVGRILSVSGDDPRYLVSDELVSTVSLADAERRNITK